MLDEKEKKGASFSGSIAAKIRLAMLVTPLAETDEKVWSTWSCSVEPLGGSRAGIVREDAYLAL